jgi:hypothetical protein
MKTAASIKLFVLIGSIFQLSCCHSNTDSLTAEQRLIVKDSVQQMVESIAVTITDEGPIAWLRYFENSPDFYMASEGQLAFANNDAATNFLKNIYVKSVSKIELSWHDVRIDPLTNKLAGIAAIFHEDITDTVGRRSPSDGYFTAIAHQTSQGCQLRNAHWSIMPVKK